MTNYERFQQLTQTAIPTEDERYQRDLYAVTHPDVWPTWPLFPMIAMLTGAHQGTAAVLVDSRTPVLYVKNLFLFTKGQLGPQLEGVETIEYASFEELVQEWRGD